MMDEARPKLTNDEDELMRMQEEFLAGRIQKSCVEIIKTPRPEKPQQSKDEPARKSIFAQKREEMQKESKRSIQIEMPKVSVLKDIVEKCDLGLPPAQQHPAPSAAFPEVFRLEKSIQPTGHGKKSIFALQIQKSEPSPMDEEPIEQQVVTGADGECSRIARAVLGETEATKIHKENAERISSMTREEIEREREQLLRNLDPKVVAFLKRKKTSEASSSSEPPAKATPSQKASIPEAMEEEDPDVEEVRELKEGKWLHMDVVEKEKLRWMEPLPPPESKARKHFQARFDFDGRLLPADIDLPVTTGLYSHGEEPERAGYSVNELMLLSRSSQLQQRVLALNTLARVLERARMGDYDLCFQDALEPLIPTLVDNGLVVLLRFCMDDSSPAVVSAALAAFSRLLSSPFDETCLDRCLLLWRRSDEQPDLNSRVHIDPSDQEQEAEMKDDEMIRIDIVRACLRMDVPRRISYILGKMRPDARGVLAALDILTRMARHSSDTAQSILDTPMLMSLIFRHFLPSDWSSFNSLAPDKVYGQPVRQALRLARVIAAWSPQLAGRLASEHPTLLRAIQLYVAADTAQLALLPGQEGLSLVLESYHTWRTLLRHGIGIQSFMDFFPAWFPQLQSFFNSSVSMEGPASVSSAGRFSHQLGAAMLWMMEALLDACCQPAISCGHQEPPFHCLQVSGLQQLVEMCVAKWSWQLRQLSEASQPDESAAAFISAGLHFLATFYSHWMDPQAVRWLDELCSRHILPLLSSPAMAALADGFITHSNLINPGGLRSVARSSESLPSVSPVAEDGQVIPVLSPPVPFPLPVALFRLLRIWRSKSSSAQEVKLDVPGQCFDYLERIGRSVSALSSNWYTRYELQFVHQLLLLSVEWDLGSLHFPDSERRRAAVHQAALASLACLPSGEESSGQAWIRRIIFHPDYVAIRPDAVESVLERMHIGKDLPDGRHSILLDEAVQQLDRLASFYAAHLFQVKGRPTGLVRKDGQILPADWIYLPLVGLYQRELGTKPGQQLPMSPESELNVAVCTLKAVYVLLTSRPAWFFRTVEPTEHYARLACAFLAGNSLFLEPQVSRYLRPILRAIASRPLNFGRPIRGVEDFLSFYEHLVQHFEAVSYGDPLFGAFLLLPLQQSQPAGFRLKLWCEHPDTIRILTLKEEEMLARLDHWLEPAENDQVLLMKYAAYLRSSGLRSERQPVLWRIATHHNRLE